MKLSRFVLIVCSLGAMVTSAAAADLRPVRKAPVPPPIPVGYSWTGFYIGVAAGAGFGDQRGTNSIFLPANSVTNSLGTDGILTLQNNRNGNDAFFVGGGQIGYNWQATPGFGWVWGIEADIQYVDMGRSGGGTFVPANYTFIPTTGLSRGLAFAPPPATVISNGASGLDFFGTVRGRIGYAFDNLLLYATGGFAYGGGDDRGGLNDDDIRFGYAAGGGLEYGFSRNWTVKVEGLYVSLDRRNRGFQGTAVFDPATNTVTPNSLGSGFRDLDFGLVRAGINYRF